MSRITYIWGKNTDQAPKEMAGHSKWSKIKRQKAVVDAAKGKVFTKIIREITIAAREGGGDPATNARLSLAIDNAKSSNMPKDNIERAIKKGVGDQGSGSSYIEVVYEGYGPGGVAYLVEASTDNVNRTVGEIRHIFSKQGGNMGTSGSVAYLFEQKGIITIEAGETDLDTLMLDAIEAGAEDVEPGDETIEVTSARSDLYAVRQALETAGYKIVSAELQRIPSTTVQVDADAAVANFKLMEKLEDNDDVGNVFSNMDLNEETLAVADRL
jgi:YebC/PmpR family DNA-binding regulatory protein